MISKEKENKIIEMYQHDYTYDEIMAAEEITANTIAAVLRRNHILFRNQNATIDLKKSQKVIRMYENRFRYFKIMQATGCNIEYKK